MTTVSQNHHVFVSHDRSTTRRRRGRHHTHLRDPRRSAARSSTPRAITVRHPRPPVPLHRPRETCRHLFTLGLRRRLRPDQFGGGSGSQRAGLDDGVSLEAEEDVRGLRPQASSVRAGGGAEAAVVRGVWGGEGGGA